MTPRLKETWTKIVRKNQIRPEIMFFPGSKIKTYFPFTLPSSSCPSIYILYIHLYVYTYLYLCLHVGFFYPKGRLRLKHCRKSRYWEFSFPKTDWIRGLAELTGTWEASWPRLIILISSTGISFLFLTYHGDRQCYLYKQHRTAQSSISIFTLPWIKNSVG